MDRKRRIIPDIRDKSTVEAIAREFTSNGRNKEKALRKIGYSDSYCSTKGIGEVYSNVRVIAAIKAIDEHRQVEADYGYDQAMQSLNDLIDTLTKQVKEGNLSAKSLLLQTLREKNDITGLHKQHVISETVSPPSIDDNTRDELKAVAQQALVIKLRQA